MTWCHMNCMRSKSNNVPWKCVEGNIFLQEEPAEAAFICSESKHLPKAFHLANEGAKSNNICFLEMLYFLLTLKIIFRSKRFLLSRKRYRQEYTENFSGRDGLFNLTKSLLVATILQGDGKCLKRELRFDFLFRILLIFQRIDGCDRSKVLGSLCGQHPVDSMC